MDEMLAGLMKQLEKLDDMEVVVSAKGVYQNRKRTKVQAVAMYQNEGTEKISAAKFVQAAEEKNNSWLREIDDAIAAFLFHDDLSEMRKLGRAIASGINKAVNRIDTRRLKHSMRHIIKK